MSIEIKFEGGEKLNRKLREVARKFPRERDLFLRGEAELLKGRTKLLTPVDTGALRNSWQRTEPAGGSIDVYSNCEYVNHVEFGHRIVAWGHDTGRVQPGVFMLRDSLDETAEKFPADAHKLLARIFN